MTIGATTPLPVDLSGLRVATNAPASGIGRVGPFPQSCYEPLLQSRICQVAANAQCI